MGRLQSHLKPADDVLLARPRSGQAPLQKNHAHLLEPTANPRAHCKLRSRKRWNTDLRDVGA